MKKAIRSKEEKKKVKGKHIEWRFYRVPTEYSEESKRKRDPSGSGG